MPVKGVSEAPAKGGREIADLGEGVGAVCVAVNEDRCARCQPYSFNQIGRTTNDDHQGNREDASYIGSRRRQEGCRRLRMVTSTALWAIRDRRMNKLISFLKEKDSSRFRIKEPGIVTRKDKFSSSFTSYVTSSKPKSHHQPQSLRLPRPHDDPLSFHLTAPSQRTPLLPRVAFPDARSRPSPEDPDRGGVVRGEPSLGGGGEVLADAEFDFGTVGEIDSMTVAVFVLDRFVARVCGYGKRHGLLRHRTSLSCSWHR